MAITRNQFSYFIFLLACLCCATGLPLSKVLISNSLFIMAGAWLIRDDLASRFRGFLKNRTALILSSLYLLHVIGLLWTDDFKSAGNDLRVKLPILLFPMFLASGVQLERKHVKLVLEVFAAAVTLSVLCGFAVWSGLINKEIKDIRDISLFVSHIRLSLMICIATGYHYLQFGKDSQIPIRLWRLFSVACCIAFLFLTGSITGLVILGILILLLILKRIFLLNRKVKAIVLTSLAVISIACTYIVIRESQAFYNVENEDLSQLETHTIHGKPYSHYIDNDDREEGRRVYLYISWEELNDAWVNRSSYDFEGLDKKGQELKYTLVRYMTALDLRKDKEGFEQLSDRDIRNVEDGITNPRYEDPGIRSRMHQVMWEIDNYIRGNDPSGHSVSMRFEFWKNGIEVFEEYPLIGTGTGDVKQELDKMYDARRSSLSEKWRLRPHNQYLTFAVTFGVIGLAWFIVVLFYPLYRERSSIYIVFITVVAASMLTEDTLETQQGVTLYAFFNSFLLFQYQTPGKKPVKD